MERFLQSKTNLEKANEPKPIRSFVVDGEAMGICLLLALRMTKTGKGNFIVKAYEGNEIDPETKKTYSNDQVRMIIEGQEDFSAYNKALERILEKRKMFLESFGEFYAGMAVVEEMAEQVEYFRLGIGN